MKRVSKPEPPTEKCLVCRRESGGRSRIKIEQIECGARICKECASDWSRVAEAERRFKNV